MPARRFVFVSSSSSELKNAVEKEDYEDAARLRDQIQTTEETLNNPDEVGTHADSE